MRRNQGFLTKILNQIYRCLHLEIVAFYCAEPCKDETCRQYFSVRKSIFVDQYSWNIPVQNGLEIDQFDNKNCFYTFVKYKNRFLMGARGHHVNGNDPQNSLLEKLISEHSSLANIDASNLDWDVTRLCADQSQKTNQIIKIIALRIIFSKQTREAAKQGCSRVISVTSPKLANHFKKIGFPLIKLSENMRADDCDSSFAVYCVKINS